MEEKIVLKYGYILFRISNAINNFLWNKKYKAEIQASREEMMRIEEIKIILKESKE